MVRETYLHALLVLLCSLPSFMNGQAQTFTSPMHSLGYESNPGYLEVYEAPSFLNVPYITSRQEYSDINYDTPINSFIKYYNAQTLADHQAAQPESIITRRTNDQIRKAYLGKASIDARITAILHTTKDSLQTAFVIHQLIGPGGVVVTACSPFINLDSRWYLDARENRRSIATALSSIKIDILSSLLLGESFPENKTLQEISRKSIKSEGFILESIAYFINQIVFNKNIAPIPFEACCIERRWRN